MPRRNKMPKIPDYTGIPQDDCKLIVQKSNPLKTLSETGMSLVEFKILDAYLSRIDSHNPDKRFVRFEKGELEKILGVTRILKDDLDARLDGLFKNVTIRDKHKDKGFTKIGLFERAEATQDDDGLWQVDLVCTPSAMEYIFNIEVMGYLPYMLKNIIELTSRYSYVLYIYLESRRKSPMSNTWQISIEELKQMLRCTSESYSSYYRFNDLVLKKCHREITEKTDLQFSYQPTEKKGRKYTSLQFTIETQDQLDGQLTLELENEVALPDQSHPTDEDRLKQYGSEYLVTLAEGCKFEFDKEQMEQIERVLVRINIPRDGETDSMIWGRHFYLMEKYAALNAEAAKKARNGNKPIKDRFRYFLSMLEKDTFQPVAYSGH